MAESFCCAVEINTTLYQLCFNKINFKRHVYILPLNGFIISEHICMCTDIFLLILTP